jgi:hypothetical protein
VHWVPLSVTVTVYVPPVLTLIGFPVPVNPPGPVHANENGPAPAGTAVRFVGVADWQTVTGATVTPMFGFTVSRPEPVPVHCVLLLSVTVTVYVPPVVTLIGLPVAVNPPGPVHANVYGPVPPEGVAVKVVGSCAAQTVGLFTVTVGFGLTVNVPEPVPVHCVLLLSVTVTVYAPPTLTVIGLPVAVKPPGPVHANVYGPVPPEGVAVSVVDPAEAQIAGLFTVTVGFGLIVSRPEPVPVHSVLLLSVTVTV